MDRAQELLAGRYQIEGEIGEGGMAVVYKAFDLVLERPVAVKYIRAGSLMDDEFRARFQREARTMAKLAHPNIVFVYDYGEAGEYPYLVMDYLPGGTLKAYSGQRVSLQRALAFLLPIARGLAYAHQQGLVHRDLKPDNILFTKSGESMLSDFGLARMLDTTGGTRLTFTGTHVGTPEYMAPEQWRGKADERSDVYSLGVILYELLIGYCPFSADTPAGIFLRHKEGDLPSPRLLAPDLPVEVEDVLSKALAKKPKARYQSVPEMIEALEKLSAKYTRPVISHRRRTTSSHWKLQKRSTRLPGGAVFALIFAILFALATIGINIQFALGFLDVRNGAISFLAGPTYTITATPSRTPTASPTSTSTPTATFTRTPLPTQTSTPSFTPSATPKVLSLDNLSQWVQLERWKGSSIPAAYDSLKRSVGGYDTVEISPDNTWTAKIVDSSSVEIRFRQDQSIYCTLDDYGYVTSLLFSQDSNYLMVGSSIVQIIRMSDCSVVRELRGFGGWIDLMAIDWTAESGQILVVSDGLSMYVWGLP
jgi:serine/threonine protein kinase